MRKTLAVLIAVLMAAVLTVVAGPVQAAYATYPGDNGRLAFGMGDTTGAHIYSVSPDGHGLQRLTSGPYRDLCPAYSATGRDIAFCSNRSGSFEIWSMMANGHHLRQLTTIVSASFPDYSPHGGRIVFDGQVTGNPNDELFVMNSDGSDLRQLTSGAGNNDWPAWSPDGRRIAFISDRTGIEQVFTMRADGARQTQLTFQLVAHGQVPDWRPDGRQIAYAQGEGVHEGNREDAAERVGAAPGVPRRPRGDFGPAWCTRRPTCRHESHVLRAFSTATAP